jgi:hypothetical protein
MRLGNAMVVPSGSFADLMARAPVFNKTPFMEVVGGNAGLTAGLVNQALSTKAELEGARIQADTLKDIEKLRRETTIGERLRAVAPALMQSFQGLGGNRLAGELLNLDLGQGSLTPNDLLAAANDFQGHVNDNRALQYPWIASSQAGAKRLLGGT